MLHFQDCSYDSLEAYSPALLNNPLRLCEYVPYEKAMWEGRFQTQYCLQDGALFLKEKVPGDGTCFLLPRGGEEEKNLQALEEYCRQAKIRLAFSTIPEEAKDRLLLRYPHAQARAERDWDDYLYLLSDFASFPGKKFAAQRNHVSRFLRENPAWEILPAGKEDIQALKDFYLEYEKGQENEHNPEKKYEAMAAYLLLDHLGEDGLLACYLKAQGKICAFAIGEKSGDVLFEHIEKADRSKDGAYAMIAQGFAKMFGAGLTYLNREDDAGDAGLRTSKMRYNPVLMLHKLFISLASGVDLVQTLPRLETSRLLLRPIEEKDQAAYGQLYRDEELNKYWGYDYRSDLQGQEPSDAYFFQMARADVQKKDTFAFMLEEKGTGAFLGETVLYDFQKDGSAYLGIRLLKEAQGQGYAYEALKRMLSYAYEDLQVTSLFTCAYKENTPSLRLIKKLPSVYLEEKEGREYFRLNRD
jgi:RimJ/RimL family protein N-acetyltransferase